MEDGRDRTVVDQKDAITKLKPNLVVGNADQFKLVTKFTSGDGSIMHSTKGLDTGNGILFHYSGEINGIPVTAMEYVPGVKLVEDPLTQKQLENAAEKGYDHKPGMKVVII